MQHVFSSASSVVCVYIARNTISKALCRKISCLRLHLTIKKKNKAFSFKNKTVIGWPKNEPSAK